MKKSFKNIKVRTKLITGFFIVALISAAIGFVGVRNINRLSELNTIINEKNVMPLMYISNIREAFQRIRVNVLYLSLAKTGAETEKPLKGIEEDENIVKEALAKLKPILDNTNRRKIAFIKLSEDFQKYVDYMSNIINHSKARDFKAVEKEIASKKAVPLANNVAVSLADLNKFIVEEANRTKIDSESTSSYAQMISLAFATIGVILAIILGVSISIAISRPLKNLTLIAQEVKEGNFHTDKSSLESKNEIGVLAAAFNDVLDALRYKADLLDKIAKGDLSVKVEKASEKDMLGQSLTEMVDSLNNLLQEVSGAIQQVASGAAQISSTSQDLSGGASEQASSIEEISATIEEINSQAKLNSENTMQSAQIAKSTLEIAAKGNEKMGSLLEAMLRIDESAARIKKIVKFIDDIAFQINLLALNANVEAARAGKYGKGFAVVADEVRNLAVKSAGSVKETESMVEETIKNITVVQSLVNDAAAIFAEISTGSAKTSELLEEVSLASSEQANGLDEISKGIIQIDGVTQSNTANAEETAASSEELSSQSEQLKILIERFNLRKSKALPLPENKQMISSYSENDEKFSFETDNAHGKNTSEKKNDLRSKNSVKPSSVIQLEDDHEVF